MNVISAMNPKEQNSSAAGPLRWSAVQRAVRMLMSAGLVTTLTACAVGPNFSQPVAPVPDGASYTPTALPAQTASAPGAGGAAQRFANGQDIPAQWWTLFHSEPLDALIRSAITESPSLVSAQAALRQAQESLNAERGSLLLPAVSGQLSGTREKTSVATAGPQAGIFNLYNAAVNVSYTLDVFGGSRRELESYAAAVDYQKYQLEATYLTLTSNIVTTAIREASLRAQLQATRDILDAQQKQYDLVNKQFQLGAIARANVLQQSTQVAQTRATLAPLEKSLAQTRHQLAVYAGKLPGEGGLPEFTLESLSLPQDLPVSLPSALVRQRPDLRANEALLHEASANVGVATANLYPQITLSGSYGSQALKAADLFKNPTTVWSLAAGLTQPIFNGGALTARKRAAEAAYDQAYAQYRQTVLTAFQNVADALRALDSDATSLQAQADAESQAKQLLDLSTTQYKLGATSYLSLLDAQRTYQQARVNLVQAQATRYSDTAALFQAMGGGWWNREQPLADARIRPLP